MHICYRFFYYDTIKLTKNDYFYPFCTKSMEQCSKKSAFFQSRKWSQRSFSNLFVIYTVGKPIDWNILIREHKNEIAFRKRERKR